MKPHADISERLEPTRWEAIAVGRWENEGGAPVIGAPPLQPAVTELGAAQTADDAGTPSHQAPDRTCAPRLVSPDVTPREKLEELPLAAVNMQCRWLPDVFNAGIWYQRFGRFSLFVMCGA